jgi:hypothetical protein
MMLCPLSPSLWRVINSAFSSSVREDAIIIVDGVNVFSTHLLSVWLPGYVLDLLVKYLLLRLMKGSSRCV